MDDPYHTEGEQDDSVDPLWNVQICSFPDIGSKSIAVRATSKEDALRRVVSRLKFEEVFYIVAKEKDPHIETDNPPILGKFYVTKQREI